MRHAIAWSYDLLSPPEQTLFRRLSVFPADASIAAAEALSRAGEQASRRDESTPLPASSTHPLLDSSVFDGIEALLDKSLLRTVPGIDGEPWIAMLETIRDFGQEQLVANGEADTVHAAHAHTVHAFAAEAESALSGPDQGLWLDRLDVEQPNLQAAFTWATTDGADPVRVALGLSLATHLWKFWETRGYQSEGRVWLNLLISLPATSNVAPRLRAAALNDLGNLNLDLADYPRARSCFTESLALRRDEHQPAEIADVLNNLALLHQYEGDYDPAVTLHEESLALRRDLGDPYRISLALYNLGDTLLERGDVTSALTRFREVLDLRLLLGNPSALAYARIGLGKTLVAANDPTTALPLLDDALTGFRAIGERHGAAEALRHHGDALGQPDTACPTLQEAISIANDLHDLRALAEGLDGLARVLAQLGDAPLAARLFGAAGALRLSIGAPRPAVAWKSHEAAIALVRHQLGLATLTEATAAGADASLDTIIGEALATTPPLAITSPAATPPVTPSSRLTPRELEVLRLLVTGIGDRATADALSISPRTVERHVTNMLDKLDLPSRTALVAHAVRHGLA